MGTENEVTNKDVIIAYQEIMNRLKIMNAAYTDDQDQQELPEGQMQNPIQDPIQIQDQEEENRYDNILEFAYRETEDGIAENIAELKSYISIALDDIKFRLIEKQKEFSFMQQAIMISKAELSELENNIKAANEARQTSFIVEGNAYHQLKEREASMIAREEEFLRLKEMEAKFAKESRAAIQRTESMITETVNQKV